ncbi:GatB/YqeY domain-containing protein [Pedococcus sp. 5OH_020]|uniref:GatB/YqeY domain-containing protein n=1 Tax=Pedococcus sp. 5OH_020 TaxID=2989814 RepID=UPI0022E9C2E3|nr:GatB/YqeY domain-containing protein [Pedococcus sp. 5OH_020]
MTAQSLKATVQSDLTSAIRQRDQVRSGTLRMVLAAISNEEVAGKQARELTDDEVLKVLAKEAKKRKEASTAYVGAGRPELAAKEDAELAVLEAYLPAQLSDEELEGIVATAVEQTGATGLPQLGQVMKVAQAAVAGRADGGRVAAAVKSALSGT